MSAFRSPWSMLAKICRFTVRFASASRRGRLKNCSSRQRVDWAEGIASAWVVTEFEYLVVWTSGPERHIVGFEIWDGADAPEASPASDALSTSEVGVGFSKSFGHSIEGIVDWKSKQQSRIKKKHMKIQQKLHA